MSVELIYKCDLCGMQKEVKELRGVWWASAGPNEHLDFVDPEQRGGSAVHTHLCLSCIEGVCEASRTK